MTTESIKKKIAALLAKAEGTDNEFEAATFMAKVNELLEKHQLDMHDIRKAAADGDPMGMELGGMNIYASMLWAREVAGALARYYGCRFVYRRVGNHFNYDIVGRESARTTFELMLPFVVTQVKLQAKHLWSKHGQLTRSVWERQVGQALMVRIYNLVPQAEDRRSELTGKGLIPVTDIEAAMADYYPELKIGKARHVSFTRHAADAAEKVSLHHQTTGKHTKQLEG